LAEDFLRWHYINLRAHLKQPEHYLLVTPPNRHAPKPDHAVFWAKALAGATGILWAGSLSKIETSNSQSSQKEKTLPDRQLVELTVENFQLPREMAQNRHIIFVDDLITSGNTAQAARRALQCRRSFEVWSLAWRPRLLATDP